MVTFAEPRWLFLLVLLLPLWWIARHRATRRQTLVRSAIFVLLIGSLAAPGLRTNRTDTSVVFIVDSSSSMGAGGRDAALEWIGKATDGKSGASWQILAGDSPGFGPVAPDELPDPPASPAGDPPGRLAELIRQAEILAPADRPNRFVLITDGQEPDIEGALASAASVSMAGSSLDVVPVEVDRHPEVELEAVLVPERVDVGETVAIRARVRSTGRGSAAARVFYSDLLVAESGIEFDRGEQTLDLAEVRVQPGSSTVEVRLVPAGGTDTLLWNNSATVVLASETAAGILVVDREPALVRPVAGLLETLGFEVEVRPFTAIPKTVGDYQDFGLVILSDVGADGFGDAEVNALKRWISDFGGGLLVTGGEEAFAAGGYFGTGLADLLPVRIDYEDTADLPVSALLVVLDRSGSMAAQAGGATKMALANQGAVRTLELLQSKDLFGVFAVDTQVRPVLPLGRISDRAGAVQRILAIDSAGGGIYIYTALGAAFRALDQSDARIRHLILFSDAADAEEKSAGGGAGGASSLDLATAMLSRGITTSVVALGNEGDRDTGFLRTLAARGGGRFYLTSDANTLPRIFAEETLRATRSNLVEEAFRAVPAGSASEIDGIDWGAAPFLLGYNATLPRDAAEVLLLTGSGEPLFAAWRFGLGRVGVFTSDIKGRWSADWMSWPGFGQWLEQTVRSLVRRDGPLNLSATVVVHPARETVVVDAVDESGRHRNSLAVAVTRSDGSGLSSETQIARQIAPGRYEAVFDRQGQPGVGGIFAVSDGSDHPPLLLSGGHAPEPGVLRESAAFLRRLAAAGSGQLDPAAETVFRPTGRTVRSRIDLAPFLLAAVLILIPVDIWLQRR